MRVQNVNPQFQVNPDAAASVHDDGVVLMHLGQGRLYRANATGARIWLGVQQHLSVEAIATRFSADFRIAPAIALEHIVRFLAALEQHSLIQRRTA